MQSKIKKKDCFSIFFLFFFIRLPSLASNRRLYVWASISFAYISFHLCVGRFLYWSNLIGIAVSYSIPIPIHFTLCRKSRTNKLTEKQTWHQGISVKRVRVMQRNRTRWEKNITIYLQQQQQHYRKGVGAHKPLSQWISIMGLMSIIIHLIWLFLRISFSYI